MRFISILPDLKGQIGHILDYHLTLREAIGKNQMIHFAWVPKDSDLSLPELWEKILPTPRKKNLSGQLLSFLSRVGVYFSSLRKIPDLKNTILFLEHFRITDLVELFLALLFFKHSPQIWLLHRYSPHQMKLTGKLHARLYRLFQRKLRLKFFTDSDLLAHQQQILFQQPVTLLPIPHAQSKSDQKFEKEPHLIDCWWPGGATRPSKGLHHIIALSQHLQKSQSPIRLIVAKNALAKGVVPSPSLILIEDILDRETYDRWMNTIDIALLPYDPAVYHSATSGIFVEAISAGKIPLIHRDTWMEYETRKYGLEKLSISWESSSLLEEIETVAQDREIHKKLQTMKEAYREFHSIDTFAKIVRTS